MNFYNPDHDERTKNMPSDMQTDLPDSLKFNTTNLKNSCYKVNNMQAVQGASFTNVNQTAISASTAFSRFQLPSGQTALNLSKMCINFTIIVGGTNPANANLIALAGAVPTLWRYYCPFFQKITFKTGNGVALVDLNSVDKYSRLSSIYKLNTNDKSGGTNRGFACKSQRNGNVPTSTGVGIAVDVLSGGFIEDPYITSIGTGLGSQFLAESLDDPGVLSFPRLETVAASANTANNQFPLVPNTAGNLPYLVNTAATCFAFNYSIRLGDLLSDSVFNLDKLLYFNNNLILELTWNPVTNIGCLITPSLANAGAFLFGNSFVGGVQSYEVQNLSCSYVYERMENIVASIKEDQLESEIPIVIPYVEMSNPQVFTGATLSQSSTMRITSMNSLTSLSHIYFGIFKPDSATLFNDSNNINNITYNFLKISQNGDILCTYDLTNSSDVATNINYFPSNSIRSLSAVRYSGCVPFLFKSSPVENTYDGQILEGLPILNSNDCILTFDANMATGIVANCQHYMYHVTLRTFYLKNGVFHTNKQMF